MKTYPQSFTSTQGEQSYTIKTQRAGRTSQGNLKFQDAINEFGGLQNTRYKAKGIFQDLKAFCLYLKNPDLASVGWREIQKYTYEMLEVGWSEASLVNKFAAFRKFFEYWHRKDKKYLDPNWIPKMRTPLWQRNVIDRANFKKLVAVIPKNHFDPRIVRNYAIINLLWDTKTDYRDILALNLDDINLRSRSVKIKVETYRSREEYKWISWSNRTNESLRTWLVRRALLQSNGSVKDKQALFLNYGPKMGTRFMGKGLTTVLFRYCKQANIEYFNPNSFQATKNDTSNNKDTIKSDIENIRAWAKWGDSINFTVI